MRPDHPLVWLGFGIFIAAMLVLDLGVFHRKSRGVSLKEALIWSAVWVGLALLFNLSVYWWQGGEKALEFFTGYTVELSLSVDNLFVFLLLFAYFKVDAAYRHKILFWGIVGALVMRGLFIAAGISLLEKFHWVIYLFGALLVFSGLKMALEKDREIRPEKNPLLKLFRRLVPVTAEHEGGRFFVQSGGQWQATSLFVVLLMVESSDVLFAVDSVPAVLAITDDPLIVYTSNVFAMLGLRSMFFALEGIMKRFHHLHYGLSAVLVFVGAKMLFAGYHVIPTWLSLAVIVGILLMSIIASMLSNRLPAGHTRPG